MRRPADTPEVGVRALEEAQAGAQAVAECLPLGLYDGDRGQSPTSRAPSKSRMGSVEMNCPR
jgi:hypothetical protein